MSKSREQKMKEREDRKRRKSLTIEQIRELERERLNKVRLEKFKIKDKD